MTRTGTQMVHVPYRGSGAVATELMAGRVQLMFNSIAAFLPLVREGRLRALAVTTAAPSAAAPDIPTLAGSGLAGFEASARCAVYGPAGLPAPVVTRLDAALRSALETPQMRERYETPGLDPDFAGPDDLAVVTRWDLATGTAVIRATDIRPVWPR